MAGNSLLTRLNNRPVLGVPMGRVSVLRLDRSGGLAPGNKAFKLKGNLVEARQQGVKRLVSFGGAWSNHLHALAAVGREAGFETVGIVRGEASELDTAMLADARAWGMTLVPVSRGEYRLRNTSGYVARLQQQYGPCLVIPEGGANPEGVRGCMEIGALLGGKYSAGTAKPVCVLAVGTGTTLAGVAASVPAGSEVLGISALKGADDLESRVEQALLACAGATPTGNWRILHDFHCGGFARVSPQLQAFVLAFEAVHRIALEPVYTGKALFAIHQLLQREYWSPEQPIVMIHTGGLQGRRGYGWLAEG